MLGLEGDRPMTRIVRFEELDGQLILRIPDDVARRLGFFAGENAALSDGPASLTVEKVDERRLERLDLVMRVLEEHDEALAALAK
jgi:hypothetical protein